MNPSPAGDGDGRVLGPRQTYPAGERAAIAPRGVVLRAADHTSAVIAAGTVDIPDLVTLAAATTWNTPAARWLVPDPNLRSGVLHAWYSILAEHARRFGRVDLLADRSAAAIWLDRSRPVPSPSHYLRRLTGTCGKHAISVLRYEQLLEQRRPRTVHLQLAVLAAPDLGRAAVLLAHRHDRLDRKGIAAYTTSGSPEQIAAMVADGYQSGPPFSLPGGGPLLWPLWRPPRPVSAPGRRRRPA